MKDDGPTRRVTIAHNTAINTHRFLYWTGENHTFKDNLVENNIFMVNIAGGWNLPDFEVSPHNLYHGARAQSKTALQHLVLKPAELVSPPKFDVDPNPVLPLGAPMKSAGVVADFASRPIRPPLTPEPRATTPKLGHQSRGKAADLGAIELGSEWNFPRPGPRWATGELTPARPPLPPSLGAKWVGLE